MRFAQPNSPVKEKRIVGTRRLLGNCEAGGMRQPIPGSNHIRIKNITWIHARVSAALFVSLHSSVGKRCIHLIIALIESGGPTRSSRRLLRVLIRIIVVHNEIDSDAYVHNSKQQAADSTGEAVLKPIARISVANANGQRSEIGRAHV